MAYSSPLLTPSPNPPTHGKNKQASHANLTCIVKFLLNLEINNLYTSFSLCISERKHRPSHCISGRSRRNRQNPRTEWSKSQCTITGKCLKQLKNKINQLVILMGMKSCDVGSKRAQKGLTSNKGVSPPFRLSQVQGYLPGISMQYLLSHTVVICSTFEL